jgi:hypothetical protein
MVGTKISGVNLAAWQDNHPDTHGGVLPGLMMFGWTRWW